MIDKRNSKWRPPPSWIYYFLSILITRFTSGSSRQHYCKISLIYYSGRLSYCYCAKIQHDGMLVCRTSKVIHVPNFVQLCAIINELWAINEVQNGGRRHLEFIFFCPFRSNGLFPVVAVYITAKFQSSTSIGGWVIAVCAKIQDGGRHRLEL